MEDLISVPRPVFKVVMNGKDATLHLSSFLESLTYTDFVEGQADTLEIRVNDSLGYFRGKWYPSKGQSLSAWFGYDGEPMQAAGQFEIDEVEADGPPDIFAIRAIAAGVMLPKRTNQGRAYDDTTLNQIAFDIARRLGLKLVGKIEPIKIRRVTQIHENDLVFMRRLAGDYGYAFSVKGAKMVFFKRSELRNALPVATVSYIDLSKHSLSRYHFKDKIMDIPMDVSVSFHDPKTKRLKHYKVKNTDRDTSGDSVKINTRTETAEQANRKALSAIDEANINQTTGELYLFGNPRLVAGVNIRLVEMGKFNGIYHIVKSTHRIDRRSGYATDIEIKRVG